MSEGVGTELGTPYFIKIFLFTPEDYTGRFFSSPSSVQSFLIKEISKWSGVQMAVLFEQKCESLVGRLRLDYFRLV